MKERHILLFTLLVAGFLVAKAQNNVTVQSLQNTHVDTILKYHLAGEGVELTNGRFNNNAGIVTSNQIGSFNRNNYTQFPFATGLIMTTGACSVAAGPNSSGSASSLANVSYTDALLQQYNQGYTVQNSAALDFDFLAYADTFAFNYVFGSEEYPEYVCANYNDIFIFLLTGPDPVTGVTTTKNVAVIPGTVTAANPNGVPVSINTVNNGATSSSGVSCENGTYSAYYIASNAGSNGVEYNGRTVQLTAEGNILAWRLPRRQKLPERGDHQIAHAQHLLPPRTHCLRIPSRKRGHCLCDYPARRHPPKRTLHHPECQRQRQRIVLPLCP